MKMMHGRCVIHNAGVVVVHSVDVGPYLYLVGIHSCTYECCSVVAATTLQVVYAALVIQAYEALSYVDTALNLHIELWQQVGANIREVGLAVGTQAHK